MTFVSEDERGILGVYAGGTISTGQLVARRTDDGVIEMLYQRVTVSHESKASGIGAGHPYARQDTPHASGSKWLTSDRSGGPSVWVLETS